MTKYTGTLTTNATASFPLHNIRGKSRQTYTLFVTGTFGSGTAAVYASPNGGTTSVALKDSSGTAISYTANGMTNFELMSDPISPIVLQVTLTGATNPSLTIALFSNA